MLRWNIFFFRILSVISLVSIDFLQEFGRLQANTLEYHRYLKEVVEALESDTDFRSKLEKANEADIRVSVLHVLQKLLYLYIC